MANEFCGVSAERPMWRTRLTRLLGFHPVDAQSRDNNFYLLRLLLACRVIFGHAFVLGGVASDEAHDSLGAIYNSLGVNGFFVISGFLVTRSLLSSRSMFEYAAARIFRIVPALWFMLLVTTPAVLVVGMGTPIGPATLKSAAAYLGKNMTVMVTTYSIRGVFHGLPNGAVNGSIWSLRFEAMCYLVLGALAALGVVKRPKLVGLFAFALAVLFLTVHEGHGVFFWLQRSVRLGSLFFFGSTLALMGERLWVSAPVAFVAMVVTSVAGIRLGVPEIRHFAFGYLLISLAYSPSPWLRRVTRAAELRQLGAPDLTYGIFLYAFPIQQALYYHHLTPNPLENIAITLVGAAACAYVSSQFVEKPIARFGKKLSRRPPVDQIPVEREIAASQSASI
jgi:peptidoglycan/LPS O-acetylase OafA/YrhL